MNGIDLNTSMISIAKLLECCKEYDDFGRRKYQENCYEGKSVFIGVIKRVYPDQDDRFLDNLFDEYKKNYDLEFPEEEELPTLLEIELAKMFK